MSAGASWPAVALAALALVASACGADTGLRSDDSLSSLTPGDSPNNLTTVLAQSGEVVAVRAGAPTVADCPQPPEGVFVTPMSAVNAVGSTRQWFDVPFTLLVVALANSEVDEDAPDLRRAGAAQPEGITSLRDASVLVGERRGEGVYEDWLFSPGMLEVLQGRQADSVLVGLGSGARIGVGYIRNVYVEENDGSVTVAGLCETSTAIATAMGEYSIDMGISSYDLLRQSATDDEALAAFGEWLRGDDAIDWTDRRPRERLLDVEVTPAAVLDGLEVVTVRLTEVPEAWGTFDAVVCTWVPLGWNECASFETLEAGEISLLAYIERGAPIEVWLVDADANLSEPLGLLSTTTADHDGDSELLFTVTSVETSLNAVLNEVSQGKPVVLPG